jgi:hypothetical protein
MSKVYGIWRSYGEWEAPSFLGVYSSPAAVASYFDEDSYKGEWDTDGMGVAEYIVDVHSPEAPHFDDSADYGGKSIPIERFKPFSRLRER